MANALGRSKGEFHKGLNEATTMATITDLEAGGKRLTRFSWIVQRP